MSRIIVSNNMNEIVIGFISDSWSELREEEKLEITNVTAWGLN